MTGRIGGASAAAVVMLALAACGSSGATSSSPTPRPSPTQASSPLRGLALTAAQIESADPEQQVTEEDAPGATSLSGPQGVTLDDCGTTYPSEALRSARLQENFLAGQRVADSNEVVRYNSAAAATQAYQELKAAVANCKPWTMSGTTLQPPDPSLLDQQVLISGQVPQTRADLPPVYACFAYQFLGDMLSAVYVFRDAQDQAVHDCRTIAAAAASLLKQHG
jgi:hypothetical protein